MKTNNNLMNKTNTAVLQLKTPLDENSNTNSDTPEENDWEVLNLDIEDMSELPKAKARSILHYFVKHNTVVFVSLDLEIGGELWNSSVLSHKSPS